MTTKNKKHKNMTDQKEQPLLAGTEQATAVINKSIPKEALKLWENIQKQLYIENPQKTGDFDKVQDDLKYIGFPLDAFSITDTDFLEGQSRYVRNDQVFIELVKYAIFIKSKQLDIEYRNCNNLHWLLGVNSELKELEDALVANDKVNIEEEIGDLFFFLLSYAMEHKILFTVIGFIANNLTTLTPAPTYQDLVSGLFRKTSVLSDIEKGILTSNKAFYKYDLVSNVCDIAGVIISHIKNKADANDYLKAHSLIGKDQDKFIKMMFEDSMLATIVTNMKKLGGRYQGRFTAEEDHNRDTVKEHDIMYESMHG